MNIDIGDVKIIGIDDIVPGSGNTVKALYDGNEIAWCSFYASEGLAALVGEVTYVIPHIINVEPEYKHHGVGTKIMEEVSKRYNIYALNIENNIPEDKDDVHYSDEGLSFIQACIDKGIVEKM